MSNPTCPLCRGTNTRYLYNQKDWYGGTTYEEKELWICNQCLYKFSIRGRKDNEAHPA